MSLRVTVPQVANPLVTLSVGLVLLVSGAACIKKSYPRLSLPRALTENDSVSTCASVLQRDEYSRLTADLTATAPLGVVSTNDLHGHIDARMFELRVNENETHAIEAGGFENLARYLAALCRVYKGRLIYLDAGDSYQGTLISNMTQGEVILTGLSTLGLKASTFGNHEFDFGQVRIRDWLQSSKRHFWYVSSSLFAKTNTTRTPWEDMQAPRFARSVVVDIAGVKVGIAGYTTETTAVKSLPTNVAGIDFQNLQSVLQNEASPLRQRGAAVTLLLAHAGGRCDMRLPPLSGDTACPPSEADELGHALRHIPNAKNEWNLVIAGHTHSAQRHVIGGVPVIQTTGLGLSLGHASIEFSNNRPTVKVHDPIYLCESHFENWKGCHPDEFAWSEKRTASLGRKIPAQVMGVPIQTGDSSLVSQRLSSYRSQVKQFLEKKIATFSTPLSHDRLTESPAAACLVDAWLRGLQSSNETWGDVKATDVNAAALNAGALRSGLSSGVLNYARLFEIIPYDNTTHLVSLNRDEWIAFARAHESSPHDYLLLSQGFVLHRTGNAQPAPRTESISFPAQSTSPVSQRVVLAISTFSRTFLEKAGLNAQVIDTGISIRTLIAETLSRSAAEIDSCQRPDGSRMKIR